MFDINEIKKFIVEKYPDSCLAFNSLNHNYSDDELIGECEDFFYYEKLNWCGCGDPEIAKRCIRDYFRIIESFGNDDFEERLKNRFGVESIYDNELLLCLTYALDAAEFIEHGSIINCSWLTEEGKMFLYVLNENKDLDIKE